MTMGKYIWTFMAGIVAALVFCGPARAEWRVAETANFQIYSGGSEAELTRQAERMEAVHYLLKISTGLTQTAPAPKLRVFYVDSQADVLKAIGANPNSNIAGFYRPSVSGAIAVVPRNYNGGLSPDVILFHEYSHHFMLQYQPVAYPPWYVEGFAELVSTASFERKGQITFGKAAKHRQGELDNSKWIPLEKLFARPNGDKDDFDRQETSFYGQSWLLTHYLTLSDKRPGQLRAYSNAINAGKSDAEAFQAFGPDLNALQREAKNYLNGRSFAYKAPALPPEVMQISSIRVLTPAEEALVPEILQAHRSLKGDDAAKNIARIAAIAARFPNDPAPKMLLAEEYYGAGNYAAAETAAQSVLALKADHARSSAIVAMAQLHQLTKSDASDTDKSKRALALRSQINRAKAANPLDPVPYMFFYQSFGLMGKAAPPIAIEGLKTAVALAPQGAGLRFELADELIKAGTNADAMTVLRPLAFASHRSDAQKHARVLFEWLAAGATGDMPTYKPEANTDPK
jgi:hypothetical protein